MRVFLLDLWLDLREKRLAPVAIVLLAGIIAVPLVLAKDRSAEPAPAPTSTAAAAPAGPVVESETEAGPVDSKLQTFSPRDPFEPTVRVSTGAAGGTGAAPATGTETSGGTTGEAGGGTIGAGPPTVTGEPGTGTGGGGGTTGTTTPERRTTLFTYTVDMRFGRPGNEKLHKGVQRLELLPNNKDPKIVFLGVTTTGKTAVFLIDSSLGVDTNGKCKPSADECTFLYLRPDDEHSQAELTDQDGNTFRVHLLNIHRVTIGSSTGGGNSNSGSNRSGSGNRSPAFTGSTKDDKKQSATDPGEAPPGEPSQPFTYSGFFGDEAGQ